MTSVILTGIPLEETKVEGKYNTNNHRQLDWTYGKVVTDEDYTRYLSYSHRRHWDHLQKEARGHDFTPLEISIFFDCNRSAILTGERPLSYDDELEAIEKRIPDFTGPVFCRLDQCSPKDGIHREGPGLQKSTGCTATGPGPFLNKKQIIDALITSLRCSREFKRCSDRKEGCRMYLMPWRHDWSNWIEFRVFCYHGKVTGISQYHWCRDQDLMEYSEVLKQWASNIIDLCYHEVIMKLGPEIREHTNDNWVIDVIVDPSCGKVELVEINCFGAELAAGSALFEWTRDRDILYSDGTQVDFRYVTP